MFTKIYYQALADMGMGSSRSYIIKNYVGTERTVSSLKTYAYNLWQAMKVFHQAPNGQSVTKWGVVFGDGNAPVTINDYALSGNHFTTYNCTYKQEFNDDYDTLTTTYTITNTGNSEFTIREVGVITTHNEYSGGDGALVVREILDSPVTIPSGDVGQVTLTLKVNIPEA
jgi:hypothetical protein